MQAAKALIDLNDAVGNLIHVAWHLDILTVPGQKLDEAMEALNKLSKAVVRNLDLLYKTDNFRQTLAKSARTPACDELKKIFQGILSSFRIQSEQHDFNMMVVRNILKAITDAEDLRDVTNADD